MHPFIPRQGNRLRIQQIDGANFAHGQQQHLAGTRWMLTVPAEGRFHEGGREKWSRQQAPFRKRNAWPRRPLPCAPEKFSVTPSRSARRVQASRSAEWFTAAAATPRKI